MYPIFTSLQGLTNELSTPPGLALKKAAGLVF